MSAPPLPLVPPTPAPEGLIPLQDWGVIRAAGPESASFLQGQLTQDVLGLADDEWRLAGYCSAKGRLLASFLVWRAGPEELLLACSADLLAPTLKRLSMFVLRAKCKLSDASADVRLYGLVGRAMAAWLGDAAPPHPGQKADQVDGQVLRLADAAGVPRYLWATRADDPALCDGLPPLAPEAWRWLEVESAVPRIRAATVERFVPQMVNLELVGGVSFSKGCYPGQEVVARSQYRGTLKRRALLYAVDAPAEAGQEIFHDEDPTQPAGLVADAALAPDGSHRLLAEVKLAAQATGGLHLGSADGPALRPLPLPYALPADAD